MSPVINPGAPGGVAITSPDDTIEVGGSPAAPELDVSDSVENVTNAFAEHQLAGVSAFLLPSGGDDSATMQAALTSYAPYAWPHVMLGPGAFLWSSAVVSLLRSTPARVQGAGTSKTTIQLSTSAPRAFDFNRIAAGDLFQNITLEDFTVDANNIGGQHHTVIGTYQAGAPQYNISVTGLRVRRVKVINAISCTTTGNYSTATNHRLGIHIVPTGTNATQLTDIAIEDCEFNGGDEGVAIGSSGGNTTACSMDDVHIRRCYHNTGGTPTQYFASANFQLGSYAIGGDCTIEDCRGYNSGDVGIEIDGMDRCQVRGCLEVDAFNANYYVRQFNVIAANSQSQQTDFIECKAKNQNVDSPGWQIAAPGTGATPYESITLRGCRHLSLTGNFTGGAISVAAVAIPQLRVLDFISELPAINYTSATAVTPAALVLTGDGTATVCRVKLRDVYVKLAGAIQAGAGSVQWDAIKVAGGTFILDWDGLIVNYGVTGTSTHAVHGIDLGATTSTISGVIRRYSPTISGDTGPYGINVATTATLTIPTTPAGIGLMLDECDFSGIPSGGSELSFNGGTLRNAIYSRNCVLRTGQTNSIASAATTTLPNAHAGDLIAITGTTTISTITAIAPGERRILKFANTLTLDHAGGNVYLAGSANLATAANMVVHLICDGTNWYQIGTAVTDG